MVHRVMVKRKADMEKFDRKITNEIIEKVQEVLRSHYGDDTLEFAINGGVITPDKVKLNLEVRIKDSTGALVIGEAKHTNVDGIVKRAGLKFNGHILGSKWLVKDEVYEVVDYITKRPKYPIQLRRSDGRLSKCTAGFLKTGTQICKPTCPEFTTWCTVDPESDAVKESDVEICDRVSDWLYANYDDEKIDALCDCINSLLDIKKAKQYASYIYCELEGGIDRAIKYAKDVYKKETSKKKKPCTKEQVKELYEKFMDKYPHITIEESVVRNFIKESSSTDVDLLSDYVLSKGMEEDVQE